jgi:hypothetical protein
MNTCAKINGIAFYNDTDKLISEKIYKIVTGQFLIPILQESISGSHPNLQT